LCEICFLSGECSCFGDRVVHCMGGDRRLRNEEAG
jgi:hypothetical protein